MGISFLNAGTAKFFRRRRIRDDGSLLCTYDHKQRTKGCLQENASGVERPGYEWGGMAACPGHLMLIGAEEQAVVFVAERVVAEAEEQSDD